MTLEVTLVFIYGHITLKSSYDNILYGNMHLLQLRK